MWYNGSMPDYITNKELVAEIVVCQPAKKVSDKLVRMLLLFVERYSTKANWRYYSYRDEMVANAICHLVTVGEKSKSGIPPVLQFDATYAARAALKHAELTGKLLAAHPNAFAYVTQIVKNSFLKTLRTEKNQTDIRDEILIANGHLPSFNRQQIDSDEWNDH